MWEQEASTIYHVVVTHTHVWVTFFSGVWRRTGRRGTACRSCRNIPFGEMVVLCLCLLVAFLGVVDAGSKVQPTVKTSYGEVRGRRVVSDSGRKLDVFLGIPYAAPPVGSLRFAAPAPPAQWSGVKDAVHHGARCQERIIPEDPPTPDVPYSEDCLFLDVYTPRPRRGKSANLKFPTMLYIHGGGFYGGTGALYNFTNVAERDVTVVVINYRLDVFGFLSTEDDVIPGNFGLMDQLAALNWVKANIAAFGGDPDDVTLFGGSAGAVSVSLFTLSPLTRGTFQKAIMQSGSSNAKWAVIPPDNPVVIPRDLARVLGKALQCDLPGDVTADDVATGAAKGADERRVFSRVLLKCLRARTADLVINASRIMQKSLGGVPLWNVVVESTFGFLPDTPQNLLNRSDEIVSIPTLRGYNRDDFSYYVSDPEDDGLTSKEFLANLEFLVNTFYPDNSTAVLAAIVKEYVSGDPDKTSPYELRSILIRIFTDFGEVAPQVEEAELFSKGCGGHRGGGGGGGESQRADSYLFEFSHRPSFSQFAPWQGVVHADEKGFVLGLPQGPDPFEFGLANEHDKVVSEVMVTLWTNFAKYGNPTPSGVTSQIWLPFAYGAVCDGDDIVDNNNNNNNNNNYEVSKKADETGKLFVIKETPDLIDFNRAETTSFWTKTIPEIAEN